MAWTLFKKEKLGLEQQQTSSTAVKYKEIKKKTTCFTSQIPDLERILVFRERWVKANWL